MANYALDRWKVQRHILLTRTPTKKGTRQCHCKSMMSLPTSMPRTSNGFGRTCWIWCKVQPLVRRWCLMDCSPGRTFPPTIFQTHTRRQSTQGGCYEQFSASRSSCSQTNMEGKSYFSTRGRSSRLGCCQLGKNARAQRRIYRPDQTIRLLVT